MILLVTGSSRAQECAAAIEKKTHHKTVTANSPAKAIEYLQLHECDALVMDESFQQVNRGSDNLVLAHGGSALPIYVNLALHGADRVTTDVACGLQRLVGERTAAMHAAVSELRSELRGEVTAILLNSELAMREKSLAQSTAEKLGVVHEIAERMRSKLDGHPPVAAGPALKPRLVKKSPAAPLTN
jgi:DNA-binding NarL/FixJ family response regulator